MSAAIQEMDFKEVISNAADHGDDDYHDRDDDDGSRGGDDKDDDDDGMILNPGSPIWKCKDVETLCSNRSSLHILI